MNQTRYGYRSDWPEKGYPDPLFAEAVDLHPLGQVVETACAGVTLQWVAQPSGFETGLYGIDFVNLHLQAGFDDHGQFARTMGSHEPLELAGQGLDRLLGGLTPTPAYVSTRIVQGAALAGVLEERGFEVVEHRRLFTGRISSLRRRLKKGRDDAGVRYTSLARFQGAQNARRRQEILDICRAVFTCGHSRYFNDPVLVRRRPGLDYILEVMKLNFEHVRPEHFFLAIEGDDGPVLGFTVLGQKPGLLGTVFSQLLSAVLPEHQGRGIYYGLTRIMALTLSPDTRLLNVTHAANRAIQKAYHNSGRVRLADSLVFRRVLHSTGSTAV